MHRSRCRLTCVAVLGAGGSVGKALSLLLRRNPLVKELRLYDSCGAQGVAADVAHVPGDAAVIGFATGQLPRVLAGAEIVLVTAGMTRRPGMTRDDFFYTNAYTVCELMGAVARHAPHAVIGLATNPLNSMIAVAATVLESLGAYDPRKLCGLLDLDLLRARTTVAEMLQCDPNSLHGLFVLGGHCGQTIIPVLSHMAEPLSDAQREYVSYRLRCCGDEPGRVKPSPTSATAWAGASAMNEWAGGVLRALCGEPNVVLTSMVESTLFAPRCRFFGSPVEFGPEGVQRVLPLPPLDAYEERLLDRCLPDLERNIRKGVDFVQQRLSRSASSHSSTASMGL